MPRRADSGGEAATSAAGSGKGGGADDLTAACAREPANDLGNARRLIARYGGDLLFADGVGWLVWTGTHWSAESGTTEARLRAHRTGEAIRREAEILQQEGPRDGEAAKDFADRIRKRRDWAVTSGNSRRVSAMIEEAVPYLSRQIAELDPDAFAFNVQNGTLELRHHDAGGVRLRKHRRGDMISKLSPVRFDRKADAPLFHAFLARVLPDPAVRAFLQRYLGYAMTGDTSEQCLVLLHGRGANGKSTLVELVSWLLGDYATALPFASLLHDDRRRGSEPTPDIARLPGARLVSASEPEIGQRFSESFVKQLTGGETITARNLNQPFFEFRPAFKLLLSFNHKPNVRGQDEGIWRRLHLVPFDVEIPPPERDLELLAKLKTEGPGVLNWLLDGLRLWLEDGLAVPEVVRAATDGYRVDSDPVGQFLAAATSPMPGARVQASLLYGAYAAWCRQAAYSPWSQNAFGRSLADRGLRKIRSRGMEYLDLQLDAAHDPGVEAEAG
jgi:putative DNA primase/helicase